MRRVLSAALLSLTLALCAMAAPAPLARREVVRPQRAPWPVGKWSHHHTGTDVYVFAPGGCWEHRIAGIVCFRGEWILGDGDGDVVWGASHHVDQVGRSHRFYFRQASSRFWIDGVEQEELCRVD